jgi:phenylalanyl-tRNA synthetase alpha chain
MEREEDKTKVAENIVLELDKSGSVDSQSFAAAHKVDHQEVVGALKSLSAREVVALEQYDVNELGLTSEGEQYANLGSPEVRLWNFLSTPQSNKACEEQLKDTFKFAMGQAMKLKWIKLVKNPDNTQTLERVASAIEDTTQAQLQLIQNRKFSDVKDVEGLKRRKLVVPVCVSHPSFFLVVGSRQWDCPLSASSLETRRRGKC